MQEAFEESIREDLDERSNYSAYADWLQDRGDPRGEFIAVQLALDEEERPPSERAELQAREKELIDAHELEWLGPLAEFLFEEPISPYMRRPQFGWRYGFLSQLLVSCLTAPFARSLATAKEALFLREFRIESEARYLLDGYEYEHEPSPELDLPRGIGDYWELLELLDAECLKNVRIFQMGDAEGEPPEEGWTNCYTDANGVERIIAGMPKIEELHLLCKSYDIDRLFASKNFDNLRVLRLLHFGSYGNRREREPPAYPLTKLAKNSRLKKLTHLLFHPHQPESSPDEETGREQCYLPLEQVRALLLSPHLVSLTHLQLRLSDMGDDGIREFIDSGILTRLKWLDLRHGCVTDEGARLLAECPDAKHLEHLDLSRNAVTEEGLAILRDAGIPARADNPLTEDELERQVYLNEGDFE